MTAEQLNQIAFYNAKIAKILQSSNQVEKPKKRETAKERQIRIEAKINQYIARKAK